MRDSVVTYADQVRQGDILVIRAGKAEVHFPVLSVMGCPGRRPQGTVERLKFETPHGYLRLPKNKAVRVQRYQETV